MYVPGTYKVGILRWIAEHLRIDAAVEIRQCPISLVYARWRHVWGILHFGWSIHNVCTESVQYASLSQQGIFKA